MVYEPLHHKYRPQTFADLVGQGAIAATLSEAIATVRIAPAYLFCGPRGTGKTSSARIFAKSLNCGASSQPTPTPCGQCGICRAIAAGTAMDVIEIDAASNTGVDNIREIIERAQFAPVQCRYKLYLIDEVHMLSTAAFNALLKTLEEPPARVVFVLATTDPQRVLPTIISRCQRFDFRRIPLQDMVRHLRAIADKESIQIADDAIALVAQVANGGLRDAESLLDQLSLLPGEVAIEQVWDLVGAIPERELLELLQALRQGETIAIVEQCRRLMDRGREPLAVLQNLAGFFRDLLLAKTAPKQPELAALTAPTWEKLVAESAQWEISRILQIQHLLKTSEGQVRHSTQPRLWLEVTLLTLCQPEVAYGHSQSAPPVSPNRDRSPAPVSNPAPSPTPTPTPAPPAQAPPPAEQNGRSPTPAPVAQPVRESAPERSPSNENMEQVWEQVLACIKLPVNRALFKQHCRLLAIDAQTATVGVRTSKLYPLAANKKPSLDAAFETAFQRKIGVTLKVGLTPPTPAAPEARDVSAPASDRSSQVTAPASDRSSQAMVSAPASDRSSQVTAPASDRSSQAMVSAPASDRSSQVTAPVSDRSSQVTAPVSDRSSQAMVSAPASDRSSQVTAPASDRSSQAMVSAPASDRSSQVTAPVSDRSSQVTAPASDRSSQVTAPASDRSSQVTTPASDRSSQVTAPASDRSSQTAVSDPNRSTTEARVSDSPPARSSPQPPEAPVTAQASSKSQTRATPTVERRQSKPSAKPNSNAAPKARSPVPTAPEPEPVAPENQEEAIAPETETSEPSDLAQRELLEAARSLAKAMEGEVISLDDVEWEISDEPALPAAPEPPPASLGSNEENELNGVSAALGVDLQANF